MARHLLETLAGKKARGERQSKQKHKVVEGIVALELEPDIFYQMNLKVVKASQVIVPPYPADNDPIGIGVLLFIKNHEYKLGNST